MCLKLEKRSVQPTMLLGVLPFTPYNHFMIEAILMPNFQIRQLDLMRLSDSQGHMAVKCQRTDPNTGLLNSKSKFNPLHCVAIL